MFTQTLALYKSFTYLLTWQQQVQHLLCLLYCRTVKPGGDATWHPAIKSITQSPQRGAPNQTDRDRQTGGQTDTERQTDGETDSRRFYLHAIKRRRLPNKVNNKIVWTVGRHASVALQFDGNLVTEVVRNLDYVPDSGPWLVKFTDIAETQLVAVHQFHVFVRLRKVKVCNSLLVEPNVPPRIHITSDRGDNICSSYKHLHHNTSINNSRLSTSALKVYLYSRVNPTQPIIRGSARHCYGSGRMR